MSRDPRYQRLLNSKRWKMIRADYLRQHPLCERCRREGIAAGVLPDGYVTSAVDVHHKTPVEQAKTTYEMERLAYNMDGNNLEALCIPCHIKTHQEMLSHTKEKVKENKARARQRFMELNDPNYQPTEQPKPYGQQADEYLKNLEEQAKIEDIIYPDDDPNKTPI